MFPERKRVNDSYTHDLTKLLTLSDVKHEHEKQLSGEGFNTNWAVVKDRSEERRYQHSISEAIARDFFAAVTDPREGVLPWLK